MLLGRYHDWRFGKHHIIRYSRSKDGCCRNKEESEDGQKHINMILSMEMKQKKCAVLFVNDMMFTITNIEEENETKLIVYTSDAIGLDEKSISISRIKGFPLYRTIEGKTVKTTYEPLKLERKVSPAEFMIPEGYQVMTVEEFNNY